MILYLKNYFGLEEGDSNNENTADVLPDSFTAAFEELRKTQYDWKKWLAFRQSIASWKPEWEQHEYSTNQAAYHYTHDRTYIHA